MMLSNLFVRFCRDHASMKHTTGWQIVDPLLTFKALLETGESIKMDLSASWFLCYTKTKDGFEVENTDEKHDFVITDRFDFCGQWVETIVA